VIRNISLPKKEVKERMKKISSQLLAVGGFPNFFGVQRFGVERPITHLVGKCIIKGDMERAVMCYVANPIKGEREESYKARKFLEDTMDFDEAMKIYPRYLSFERMMISHLAKRKKDWVGALRRLPKNLLLMFIHAYQSYIFNEILSERMVFFQINRAIVGDIIIPRRNGIETDSREGILVNEKNLDKVNRQIEKGNAFISGIIFGYESKFAEGEMGRIERSIIEREGLSARDFIIPKIPELSCKGLRRILLAPLNEMKWEFLDTSVKMKFQLPKGCYATSLLREFMKDDLN
jgi:tRNA pseudouridine13 synthase